MPPSNPTKRMRKMVYLFTDSCSSLFGIALKDVSYLSCLPELAVQSMSEWSMRLPGEVTGSGAQRWQKKEASDIYCIVGGAVMMDVPLTTAETAFLLQPFMVECLPLYNYTSNILNGTLGMWKWDQWKNKKSSSVFLCVFLKYEH